MRRHLDRGVHARGRRAADQQRNLAHVAVVVLLHLAGDVLHFFQARRDQPRQANDVGAFDLGLGQDLVAGHHHAHVDDVEVVALQDHGDDVLADVVHVALDGGNHDLALGLDVFAGLFLKALFFLDVRDQVRHRLLHHACALDHLGQEHLALAEQVADDAHAVHQRAFDHVQRPAALGQDGLVGLFRILDDEVGDAVHQRMRQALVHAHRRLGRAAPVQLAAVVLGRALGRIGDFDQALAGVGAAVQHHVFDAFAQLGFDLVVDADHAGVDDAHVHAGLDRVVQEHGVDGLTHRVVAAERETHVANPARDLGAGQIGLDPARGLDEVDRVVVVFLDAGGDGEDVRVEDDVLGRETDLVHQDVVGAPADLDLALVGVGLALFIEGHHDRRRAVPAQQLGLLLEGVFTFLHADRVHDGLALHAAQAGLDDAPFGRVDHDRHARDVGFAGDQVQETHHRGLAVEHGLVHVDVDDLRAVLDLLARHRQRLLEVAVQDHPGKGLGAGDVGAFADVDEQGIVADGHRLEAGQAHGFGRFGANRVGWGRHGGSLSGSVPTAAMRAVAGAMGSERRCCTQAWRAHRVRCAPLQRSLGNRDFSQSWIGAGRRTCRPPFAAPRVPLRTTAATAGCRA